ncbi:hypothetical protein VCRA2110O2_30037 [Vibrio crassostreae]|nr:hypothetical protein VCRA2110O2_30037 [Vibrio crassostreae]
MSLNVICIDRHKINSLSFLCQSIKVGLIDMKSTFFYFDVGVAGRFDRHENIANVDSMSPLSGNMDRHEIDILSSR